MNKKKKLLLNLINLIKYPIITEKTITLSFFGYYIFIVDYNLTKTQIKFLFQKLLKNKILKINTSILPIKIKKIKQFIGKRSSFKKVYIKLKKNEY